MRKSTMSVMGTTWSKRLRLFSQRRYSHRHNWKNMIVSKTNDRAALKLHYTNKHPTSRKTFEEEYAIIFQT